MKVWYKNVGDTEITIITSDTWERPDERYFFAECDEDSDKYVIQWNGEVPSLIDDVTYPERNTLRLKEIQEHRIRGVGSVQLSDIIQPYSREERETWFTQETEARAWIVNNNTSCPMITSMATARGISVSLMVQKIIENSDIFKAAAGTILGNQQKDIDLLNQ
jgi:hypothetical protein